MRKKYIVPEFNYKRVYGTFNMFELTTFFGSKLIKMDDFIYINKDNIVYYENYDGEQLDYITESTYQPKVFDVTKCKKDNHSLAADENQSLYQSENNTNWIIKIYTKNILSEYIFALLKHHRTFEGIKNNMTKYNDVNTAIKDYIKYNIINKYTLKNITFYIKYNDLKNMNTLKYDNKFNEYIENDNYIMKRINILKTINDEYIILTFNQEKPSKNYSFDYYFNLYYEKI